MFDTSTDRSPLAGLRVVDMTSARSGPVCTRHLADLGADVIRVERPGDPDLAGSDAANLHRNKRSILVDLRKPEGLRLVKRLASGADVFVENWRPAVKKRLGLDADTLMGINPRLVYGSISGFGQSGPYADRPCLDQIAQGISGLMTVTGPPNSGPWRVGIAISDVVAGGLLAQGIIAALFARQSTGRGQWVHTSLVESMIHLLDFQAVRWLADGVKPRQEGNSHPTLPAMDTFRTADGFLNVAVLNRFDTFFHSIGQPELATDERFASAEGRARHRKELADAIQAVLLKHTTEEWVALLGVEFPCGPVLGVDEVFDDVQVKHLHMVSEVTDGSGGSTPVLRHPVNLEGTPSTMRSGVRRRGADAAEILSALGYVEDKVAQLYAEGAVIASDG